MNNIKNIVLEIITEKQSFDSKYSGMMSTFLTNAYGLVELSEDLYQVEQTIKLNKISLKDYILNSDVCKMLKANNISNYSIEELKRYLNNFESQGLDVYSYKIALQLYEQLEKIEKLEEEKINYEVTELSKILTSLKDIKNIKHDEYQNLYNKLIKQNEENLNHNNIDVETGSYITQLLNEIFNYYLYGNRVIPIY